jgi:hypothetical protein
MPRELDEKEHDKHTQEYFDQLGFDIKKLLSKKKTGNVVKQAQLPKIEIPDIVATNGEKKETTKPAPVLKPDAGLAIPDIEKSKEEEDLTIGDTDKAISDLHDIEEGIEEIELNEKLEDIREELKQEFVQTIKKLKEELEDLKERKVPEANQFDTGGVYKERLFEVATRVLDEQLVSLFEDVPDYSLIAINVSRTFEDGTVSDAIVSVSVTVPNNGYRYDFRIDVPILNGIIQYPTFIQRNSKTIPLTKDRIMEELDTTAFRKMDPIVPEKGNFLKNIGDNIHRRPDTQKWYEISGTEPKVSVKPEKSKWSPLKGKETNKSGII